jgi:hypothetical protein
MFKAKSKRNENYAKYLTQQPSVNWDWVITIYFYSALHLVKEFLIKKCNKNLSDIENHRDISNYLLDAVRSNLISFEFRKSYLKLFFASHTARYHYSPLKKYCNEVNKFDDLVYIQKLTALINSDYSKVTSQLSTI